MKHFYIFYIFLFFHITISAQIDRTKPPEPGPAPEIQIGTYETFKLNNGLQVFVVENHKLPRVTYSLVFDNDPVLEGEYAGYVRIAGSIIGTVTENRTKEELNEEIDFIGATLSAGASNVYAASLKKHNDKLLELMADVVLHSKLTEEELDKSKKRSISSLKASLKDPDQLSSRLSQVILFGKDHPYGEITTEESLDRIDLEMCRNYYETYYNPAIAYLAVVGDITLKEVKPLLEKHFGNWKAKEVPKKEYHKPKAPASRNIVIHDRPESVQSVIKVTYPVELMVGSPEAMKARIMNVILGGGSYRLFQNLRETHGWTYGAYSRINSDELIGKFEAFTSVRNEVTDSAVTEILYEMGRLRTEPVPDEELTRVKNYLSGNFALSLEKPETVARFALNTAMYDLPSDYYKNYLKNVSAISKEDVKKAANTYLKPDNAYIFVVGNASEIAGPLAKLNESGSVKYIDENGNYYTPEAASELPEDVSALDIIDRYIEALGGREKLQNIGSLKMKMSMNMQGMNMKLTRLQQSPDKFAMIIMMQGNVVQRQVINGDRGITTGMQGSQEITGDDLEKMKLEVTLNPELQYNELGFDMKLTSVENVNGEKAYKVILTNPYGNKIINFYNVASGLKVKSQQTMENSQMGTIQQTTYYKDYKEVNGYLFPHSLTQEINEQTMEIKVEEIEINPKIDDQVFEID